MSELSYEVSAVLCRVKGMPLQLMEVPERGSMTWRCRDVDPGPDYMDATGEFYRLTPGAPLTPTQAAICLAMGVKVEDDYVLDERGQHPIWSLSTMYSVAMYGQKNGGKFSYRVPPEKETNNE